MPKNRKNLQKLVSSKADNHNLTLNTAKKVKFKFSGQKMKEKHAFFADTKQQVDQIKRKIVANFNKPFSSEKQTFLKVKTTITFPVRKQD